MDQNSPRARTHYSEQDFDALLNTAEGNATNDFETDFVKDIKLRHKRYGMEMFLSDRQESLLQKIAKGGDRKPLNFNKR